jgi:hypothetical protein
MENGKKKITKPNGVSIDSSKDVVVGNDVVGRDKVVNVYPDGKSKSKQTNLVDCPLCGKYNDQRNSFRCLSCRRDFICLEHRDPHSLLCKECLQASELLVRRFFLMIMRSHTDGISVYRYHYKADFFSSEQVFVTDEWFCRYGEYDKERSHFSKFTIEEIQTHSSGRIFVSVKEEWKFAKIDNRIPGLVGLYNYHNDYSSLSSSFELIRVENILKIDVCYFFGCAE